MTRLNQLLAAISLVTGLVFASAARAENFPTPPHGLEGLSPLAPLLTPTPANWTFQPAPVATAPIYTPPVYTPPVYDPPCISYVYTPTFTPPVYTPPVFNPQPVYPQPPVIQPTYPTAMPLGQIQNNQQLAYSDFLQIIANPYSTQDQINAAYNKKTFWDNTYALKVQQMQAAQMYHY